MKKKNKGKYKGIRLTKLDKEKEAELVWDLIVNEVKKKIYEKETTISR